MPSPVELDRPLVGPGHITDRETLELAVKVINDLIGNDIGIAGDRDLRFDKKHLALVGFAADLQLVLEGSPTLRVLFSEGLPKNLESIGDSHMSPFSRYTEGESWIGSLIKPEVGDAIVNYTDTDLRPALSYQRFRDYAKYVGRLPGMNLQQPTREEFGVCRRALSILRDNKRIEKIHVAHKDAPAEDIFSDMIL